MDKDASEVTLSVITVLEELGVRYLIGGSLASTVHGTPRATLDADLLADVKPEHMEQIHKKLNHEFYISEEDMGNAIKRRTSFNMIHLNTLFKIDIFLPKNRPFDDQQFKNRALYIVAHNPERTAYIASAEDTILAKLEWYRLGNEASERQWRDVIGIIKVQDKRLNLEYLRQTASELGVLDLINKLIDIRS
jgi:hypothetical protein